MVKAKRQKIIAYLMLGFVLVVWGVMPPLNAVFNENFSPTFRSAIMYLVAAICITAICARQLKSLNRQYFKVAIPTGIFLAIASFVQKIGLLYTTPTKYAFLENLSCVVVPVILFVSTRKKPSFLTVVACLSCLVGSFVLTGMASGQTGAFGIGEILCALAGVLYGVNIAVTGLHVKKLNVLLYLMLQMWVGVIVSFASAILLSVIKVNGAPIETIRFSFNVWNVLLIIGTAIVANVLCWFLRTLAMMFVSPTAVSIIMPFSAVVTGCVSLLCGMDAFSMELLIGGIISLIAIILSGLADGKDG